MEKLDLIIRNGYVVLSDGIQKTDIGIRNGKIAAIAPMLTAPATHEEQADNRYIFPGMIDIHVHFNEPGRAHWEGFATGSYMMAAGGCTTYFDMPLNGIPSTTNKEALLRKANAGEKMSSVDFGLWGGLVPGNEAELASLADSGVIGFKAFLSPSGNEEFEAVDDKTLLNGMREIAKLNSILALHAESGPIIEFLTEQKVKEKRFSADDYAASRPVAAEAEAVERAIYYAEVTGCRLHFVHISSQRAVDIITTAKQRGLDVTLETCPHYLLFNHNTLVEKGAVAKCAPPLRSEQEQRRLIQLLLEDKIDMITSDHSPSPFSLKDPSSYHLFQAWGGISGGQFSLLSMIQLALKYNIPFEKIAEWTAANPASRFGLSTKGEIRTGMDADLAIIDLNQSFHVTNKNFQARHKHSIYIDHTFPCRVVQTFNRGKLVFTDNQEPVTLPTGRWLSKIAVERLTEL